MKILWVRMINFKGFSQRSFSFDGKDVTIYGDNGLGKTSVYDAVTFLFFGKDSRGQAKFEITPIGMIGSVLNPVQAEVEACFINPVTGGKTTLRRVYAEKWTKQRGRAVSEKTGYETFYWIDDVPVKEGEYKAKVAELATREEVFKLLTNPLYFNEVLKKDERRRMLFEFCDITNAQIFERFPELAELPSILDGKCPDAFKAAVMSRRKKINEAIETIPARIDEVQRSKPEGVDTSKKNDIAEYVQSLRGELDKKVTEITKFQTSGEAADLLNRIGKVELQMTEMKTALVNIKNNMLAEKGKELSAVMSERSRLMSQIDVNHTNIAIAGGDKEHTQESIEKLREEYDKWDAKEFDGCNCPFCAQVLPPAMLEEMKTTFNLDRSKKLTDIVEKGKAAAARIEKLEKEVADLTQLNTLNAKLLEDFNHRVTSLSAIIKNMEAVDHMDSPELDKLKEEFHLLNDQLAAVREGNKEGVEVLVAGKTALVEAIASAERQLAAIAQAEATDKRLAELKEEEKNLARTFELYEKHLHLIETFMRKKASTLEDHINSRFKMVTFRLFREQLNGGIEEICEAEVDGVPYNSLNNAKRVQAGLDIINTFGDYYNFHPVVFVDGRESVVRLPEMKCQVISLVVSEQDKELRVQ